MKKSEKIIRKKVNEKVKDVKERIWIEQFCWLRCYYPDVELNATQLERKMKDNGNGKLCDKAKPMNKQYSYYVRGYLERDKKEHKYWLSTKGIKRVDYLSAKLDLAIEPSQTEKFFAGIRRSKKLLGSEKPIKARTTKSKKESRKKRKGKKKEGE